MSSKVAVDKSKPVDKVYEFISLPVLPETNILVPSLLNLIYWGVRSWPLTSKPDPSPFMSSKVRVDKSKPVDNVYEFISFPWSPTINILVPSLLKAIPLGWVSWPLISKPDPSPFMSLKVASAWALLTKVRLKIKNNTNIFFK